MFKLWFFEKKTPSSNSFNGSQNGTLQKMGS